MKPQNINYQLHITKINVQRKSQHTTENDLKDFEIWNIGRVKKEC